MSVSSYYVQFQTTFFNTVNAHIICTTAAIRLVFDIWHGG